MTSHKHALFMAATTLRQLPNHHQLTEDKTTSRSQHIFVISDDHAPMNWL